MQAMCGRVIQSSGPLRYAIVDGMNVRDSRVHNYPPRWNAAPSQELLVIRRNPKRDEGTDVMPDDVRPTDPPREEPPNSAPPDDPRDGLRDLRLRLPAS